MTSADDPTDVPSVTTRDRLAALLFVVSGLTALVYQVVLSRYLQVVVGSTAHAVSALLVAFMLGMSAGASWGGRWADRTAHPLRLYALAEAAIGVYCLAFPFLFPRLQAFYLEVAPPVEGPVALRNVVRFLFGVAAFILPSLFMGVTTPAFVRALVAGRPGFGHLLPRLYALNVLGAAGGALLTAYVLVPQLGLTGSLIAGSVVNFTICGVAWGLSRPLAPAPQAGPDTTPFSPGVLPLRVGVLVAASCASGFLSFGLEIVWTHLLAVLLGNSVYAFGLMLGSLLLGLGVGARFAERLALSRSLAATGIGGALAAAGALVILSLGAWDKVPAIFLALARSSPSFAFLEVVRFLVAMLLMLGPTALLGMAFPLVLSCVADENRGLGQRIGWAYAANTLGAVGGAIVASYGLLARLGSQGSLRLLGVLLLGCGALALLGLSRSRWRLAMASLALAGAVTGWLLPVHWDFNALSTAASIYLGRSTSQGGHIVFQREDPTGGLTTVVARDGVKTLLTNGKFQGDDNEEIPIQHRLANIPTLFTPGRERALVVGLGTGVTLGAVAAHGFARTVCAEISAPIVEAARLEFALVNGNVLDAPSVELIEDDGRSVLLERDDLYDVVSVEANSIWFAGVGSLYSREFYELVSRRLRRHGVLLQWFPMHHLSARNLYLVVNTLRSAFPHVSVWTHRHQGFVVAGNEPLAIDLESIRGDLARPALRPFLRELPSGSPLELLSDVAITGDDADRFLDAMADLLFTTRDVVSTDSWPVLEYETPKDILSNFSYFQNRATLRRFRSTRPFSFRGSPTAGEQALASAAFRRGWQDPGALPALATATREAPDASGAIARWLLDEVAGEDVVGTDQDPLGALRDSERAIRELVSSAATSASCDPEGAALSVTRSVPLRVVGQAGEAIPPTRVSAVADRLASLRWSRGFQARPDGRPVRLDLALDRPRRLASVHVLARALDGSLLRARVYAGDAAGGWRPVAGVGGMQDLRCEGVRRYALPASAPPVASLRVELQGESLSRRLHVEEIWALEAP